MVSISVCWEGSELSRISNLNTCGGDNPIPLSPQYNISSFNTKCCVIFYNNRKKMKILSYPTEKS